MKFVSVDIETSGLDEATCSILEFGAVIADTNENTPVNKLPRFQRVIKHLTINWEPVAEKMNAEWYYNEALTDPGTYVITPAILIQQFANWLAMNGVDPKKVVAAGKNFASFDLKFIRRCYDYGVVMQFAHRSLDPMMLFFDPEKDSLPPDMKECVKRAGYVNLQVNHRAIDDAQLVVLLLRAGWAKKKESESAERLLEESRRPVPTDTGD